MDYGEFVKVGGRPQVDPRLAQLTLRLVPQRFQLLKRKCAELLSTGACQWVQVQCSAALHSAGDEAPARVRPRQPHLVGVVQLVPGLTLC